MGTDSSDFRSVPIGAIGGLILVGGFSKALSPHSRLSAFC
jgi:hypothetical protein